jgi:hypothetical protein
MPAVQTCPLDHAPPQNEHRFQSQCGGAPHQSVHHCPQHALSQQCTRPLSYPRGTAPGLRCLTILPSERPGDAAEPHAPSRAHLPLLRGPRGDRGRLRELPGDECARSRGRGRCARARPEAAGRTGAGCPDLGGSKARGRRDQRARGHGAARRLRYGLERTVPGRAGADRPAARRARRRS